MSRDWSDVFPVEMEMGVEPRPRSSTYSNLAQFMRMKMFARFEYIIDDKYYPSLYCAVCVCVLVNGVTFSA